MRRGERIEDAQADLDSDQDHRRRNRIDHEIRMAPGTYVIVCEIKSVGGRGLRADFEWGGRSVIMFPVRNLGY